MAREKVRLDQHLVNLGLVETRQKAQAVVMAGLVYVEGRKVDKPGQKLFEELIPEVRGAACPYVSRGGLKLEAALDHFGINPQGMTALDIGISTGGFTDCMLQRGAIKVFGVDVGKGQLDWKLRNDPRVVLFEETNFRHFEPETLGEKVDLVVVDVSFISLKLILPTAVRCTNPGALLLPMVKPQFEVGRERVGKGGVVRNEADRMSAVDGIIEFARNDLGLNCRGMTPTGVPGPKGNMEYVLCLEQALETPQNRPEI